MTIIIRTDTVISTNTRYSEPVQVASGVTVTIMPGATLDLGGHELLLAGNLKLVGNGSAFAGLSNGTISTNSTTGKIDGIFAKLAHVYVDDFFSRATINLSSSVVDDSTINPLVVSKFTSVLFRNTQFIASATNNAEVSNSTFVNSPVKVTAWIGVSESLKFSNVNFIGGNELIRLDPFFTGSGFSHSLKITNSYIGGTGPAGIDSRVFDADDDIRVNTDIRPDSFNATPFTNDAKGFVVGSELVTWTQLGAVPPVQNTPPVTGPGQGTSAGTSGNDIFLVSAGSTQFDGAGGIDRAVYSGRSADYTVSKTPEGFKVTGNSGGGTGDLFVNVERLSFADKTLALDTDGVGGQVYRLYQAVFGRTPDKGGLGYWIKQVDDGLKLAQAADYFVASAEFRTLYGAAPTGEEIVTKLYTNVLHRAPDQGGFDYWLPIIRRNPDLVEEVLVAFSESAENREQVAKVIGNGFEYEPYG